MALPPLLQRLRLPVIASPLFIISVPQLVIAQCKAGIVGSMPALNARPAELLDDWLAEITETLAAHDRAHPDAPAAPFAINQIVHRSNDRMDRDMALCSDAAQDTNGQIFAVRNNEIFLISQPRPVRSVHRSEGWTPESVLSHALPAMKAQYFGLDKSGDVFTWDPV